MSIPRLSACRLCGSNPRTINFFSLTMKMEQQLEKNMIGGFYPTDDQVSCPRRVCRIMVRCMWTPPRSSVSCAQGIMNFFLVCGHGNGTHPGKDSHTNWMSTVLQRHDVPTEKVHCTCRSACGALCVIIAGLPPLFQLMVGTVHVVCAAHGH